MAEERKILVIEDDRTMQIVIRMTLAKAGYQVHSGVDGVQGTMMARSVKPDLIILDIKMPGGDGYAVYERIRQMSDTMTIPVLIYSSVPADQIVKRIQLAPNVHILQKPSNPDALREAVAALLPPP